MSRIAIIPGNGCDDIEDANWYAWLRDELVKTGYEVAMQTMPDPYDARESIWLPFMANELRCDENTVIVGHSSGAEAAMRYLETHRVHGCILVSACVTDMGMPSEAISGYYNRPWKWETIKSNAQWIVQYGSREDPFISFDEEQAVVATSLDSEFIVVKRGGHFMTPTFPALLQLITERVPL